MSRIGFISACCLIASFAASGASAQVVSIAGYTISARSQDWITDKHALLLGSVELEREDMKLYTEQLEFFEEEDRALATGNVVLVQGENRIAADRAEFNTKTGLGTFYHAAGIASIRPSRRAPPPTGGIIVPQATNSQDSNVYFFGEVVEKQGAKKYRITNGGFSTCVQPTPRWDLSADTVVLNIDHYTLLTQAILKVKNVPMLYVPVLYFPTKEDGRATGLLIPTYEHSTYRGHTIHSAFFWAMNRSMDATLLYDWFSQTGSGAGVEYRYVQSPGSDGHFTFYSLNEHDSTISNPDGSSQTYPGTQSYRVSGDANQHLPGNLRARAHVDYFSSFTANQTFHTDVNVLTNNNSTYGGNVVGSWRSVFLNGTFDHNQYYYPGSNSSSISGSEPRISVTRSDRPLFPNSRLFFGFSSEVAHLERQTVINDVVAPNDDRSVGRLDFFPQIRFPFTRFQWFTVNTALSWRETFYTRSLTPRALTPDGNPIPQTPIDDNLNRNYFTLSAQAIGPVFTRVWDTPNSSYATRIKHTIEPSVRIDRTSTIDERTRILQVDNIDYAFGDNTSITYALVNRIYAKRKVGSFASAREIFRLSINQTHYSNPEASTVDIRYGTSNTTTQANNFSPITVRFDALQPTEHVNGSFQAEIDSRYRQLRTMSASFNHSWSQISQTYVMWSKRFFIEGLDGYNNPATLDQTLSLGTNIRTRDNKYGTAYSTTYDIFRSTLVGQRISAFYNAQCCGVAAEYRVGNTGITSGLPADHQFFMSVTLAGLGNFSPFNGGLAGLPIK